MAVDEWRGWDTRTIAEEQMKTRKGKCNYLLDYKVIIRYITFLRPKFSEWVSVAGVDVSGVEEVVDNSGSVDGGTVVVLGWSHVGLWSGRSEWESEVGLTGIGLLI